MDVTLNSIIGVLAGVFPEVIGFLIGAFILGLGAIIAVQFFRQARQRRRREAVINLRGQKFSRP